MKKKSSPKNLSQNLIAASDQVATTIRQRTVYTRIFAILLLIIALISFWWPFIQIDTSLNLNGPFGGNLVILPEETPVTTVAISDFLTAKQLDQFNFFGQKIADYKIGNYQILQILRNPLQNYGYLDTATQLISPQTATLISSPQLEASLIKYFPQYALDIQNVLQGTANVVTQASEIITSINNIVVATRQESLVISETIARIEKDLQIANLVSLFTFALIVIAIIFLCFPKINKIVSLIMIGIPTAIVSASVIFLSFLSRSLTNWNTNFVSNINATLQQSVTELINQLLGENAVLFSQWTSQQVNYLDWQISLEWQTGSILMLASLLGAFAITFFIPQYKIVKTRLNKKKR
ncbi:MAG: hypothetical protein Q4G02_00755 [bacterium]|nr:hypothetical protein [bacterium]